MTRISTLPAPGPICELFRDSPAVLDFPFPDGTDIADYRVVLYHPKTLAVIASTTKQPEVTKQGSTLYVAFTAQQFDDLYPTFIIIIFQGTRAILRSVVQLSIGEGQAEQDVSIPVGVYLKGDPGRGIAETEVLDDRTMKITFSDGTSEIIDFGLDALLVDTVQAKTDTIAALATAEGILGSAEDIAAAKVEMEEAVEAAIRNGMVNQIASPSTIPASGVDIYNVSESGTYTNFGGVVISSSDLSSGFVQLRKINLVWTKVIVPMSVNGKVEDGSLGAVSGDQVFEYLSIPETEIVTSNSVSTDKYVAFNTGIESTLNVYDTHWFLVSDADEYFATAQIVGSVTALAVFYGSSNNYLGYQDRATTSGVVYDWVDRPLTLPVGTTKIAISALRVRPTPVLKKIVSKKAYKNIIGDLQNGLNSQSNRLGTVEDKISSITTSTLSNKKIADVGDSIKFGSTASAITEDAYKPLNGTGANKTHMYHIAKRTATKWYNYGINGSTLGDCFAEGADRNGFSKASGRYTQMATDLDYLSIMFGTNDAAYGHRMLLENYIQTEYGTYLKFPRTPDLIGQVGYFSESQYEEVRDLNGTIGGVTYSNINNWAYHKQLYIGNLSDSTNKTWCGAWNIVLPYLINKYPTSKILIWLNPTNNMFDEATINICKKWGIPWLDLSADNMPLIWRKATGTAGLIDGVNVTNYRKNTFTSDGTHPNDAGYEYLSTIMESALLRI